MLYSVIVQYKNGCCEYFNLPLSLQTKILLKNKIDKNEITNIHCSCDEHIKYGISKDYRLYPKLANQQHQHGCLLQPESYKLHKQYNPGFQVGFVDGEERILVNQDFSFVKHNNISENSNNTAISMKYPSSGIVNGKITTSAFVKHLNMFVFKKLAEQDIQINNINDFIKGIYDCSKMIFYQNQNITLYQLMNCFQNIKFVYGQVQIQNTKISNRYQLIINDKIKVFISQTDLNHLLREFKNTYKMPFKKYNSCLVHSSDSNHEGYHLIFGGYVKKTPYKESFYYEFLDGCFILTNQYGLFSESNKEVIMYNHIYDYLKKMNLTQKYRFHKPDFYEPTMYKSNYIGDGIIEDKHTGKKWCVEVFGIQGNETYEKKKEIKQEELKDKLISWDPAKEDLPKLQRWIR